MPKKKTVKAAAHADVVVRKGDEEIKGLSTATKLKRENGTWGKAYGKNPNQVGVCTSKRSGRQWIAPGTKEVPRTVHAKGDANGVREGGKWIQPAPVDDDDD